MCHKTIMKHVALMACVLAASVMPTATAQTKESANSKAYSIQIKGEAVPATMQQVGYPYGAAKRSRSGHCDLLVQESPDGRIGAVTVRSCSSAHFRAEADRLASKSKPLAGESTFKPLRIEWTIE